MISVSGSISAILGVSKEKVFLLSGVSRALSDLNFALVKRVESQ
jgi:hypothetical protein